MMYLIFTKKQSQEKMPLNARPYRITHKKTEDKTENELDPREMYLLTANTRQRKAKANTECLL